MAKKPGKWDWLRTQYPVLQPECEHVDVVRAMKEDHEGKTLAELAVAINALEAEKAEAEKEMSAINAELLALEYLMLDGFKTDPTQKLTVGGYTFGTKVEPVPKISDPAAFRAWIDTNSPEILSVNYQVLRGMVTRALDEERALPVGVTFEARESLSRKK